MTAGSPLKKDSGHHQSRDTHTQASVIVSTEDGSRVAMCREDVVMEFVMWCVWLVLVQITKGRWMSPAALCAFVFYGNAIWSSAHRREYDTPRHHQRLEVFCRELWAVVVNMIVCVL